MRRAGPASQGKTAPVAPATTTAADANKAELAKLQAENARLREHLEAQAIALRHATAPTIRTGNLEIRETPETKTETPETKTETK